MKKIYKDINKLKKSEKETLINTGDDDLLEIFPGYKRSDIRREKKRLISKYGAPSDNKLPKILIFDIETSPIVAYVWGLWDQNIAINQIKSDWFIFSWSAKWLFEKEIHHDRLTSKEAKKQDDKRVTNSLWKMIDEADIIIAHNLDRFDKPKMNTRFLKHGLKYPSLYQTVDTLKVAKREFKISSNKLNYLCQFLGLDMKMDTGGFELWEQCMEGKEAALKKMDVYCRQDVVILEELYLKLRPYIHSHPNVGLYMNSDTMLCPNCGSDKLKWGDKYTTPASQFYTARCECGAFVRGKTSAIDSNRKKVLGQAISR